MVAPVTFTEIMVFFNSVLDVFSPYLLFSFSIMTAFALLTGIRKLLIGNYK